METIESVYGPAPGHQYFKFEVQPPPPPPPPPPPTSNENGEATTLLLNNEQQQHQGKEVIGGQRGGGFLTRTSSRSISMTNDRTQHHNYQKHPQEDDDNQNMMASAEFSSYNSGFMGITSFDAVAAGMDTHESTSMRMDNSVITSVSGGDSNDILSEITDSLSGGTGSGGGSSQHLTTNRHNRQQGTMWNKKKKGGITTNNTDSGAVLTTSNHTGTMKYRFNRTPSRGLSDLEDHSISTVSTNLLEKSFMLMSFCTMSSGSALLTIGSMTPTSVQSTNEPNKRSSMRLSIEDRQKLFQLTESDHSRRASTCTVGTNSPQPRNTNRTDSDDNNDSSTDEFHSDDMIHQKSITKTRPNQQMSSMLSLDIDYDDDDDDSNEEEDDDEVKNRKNQATADGGVVPVLSMGDGNGAPIDRRSHHKEQSMVPVQEDTYPRPPLSSSKVVKTTPSTNETQQQVYKEHSLRYVISLRENMTNSNNNNNDQMSDYSLYGSHGDILDDTAATDDEPIQLLEHDPSTTNLYHLHHHQQQQLFDQNQQHQQRCMTNSTAVSHNIPSSSMMMMMMTQPPVHDTTTSINKFGMVYPSAAVQYGSHQHQVELEQQQHQQQQQGLIGTGLLVPNTNEMHINHHHPQPFHNNLWLLQQQQLQQQQQQQQQQHQQFQLQQKLLEQQKLQQLQHQQQQLQLQQQTYVGLLPHAAAFGGSSTNTHHFTHPQLNPIMNTNGNICQGNPGGSGHGIASNYLPSSQQLPGTYNRVVNNIDPNLDQMRYLQQHRDVQYRPPMEIPSTASGITKRPSLSASVDVASVHLPSQPPPPGGELHAVCVDRNLSYVEKLNKAKYHIEVIRDVQCLQRPVTLYTLQPVEKKRVIFNPQTGKVELANKASSSQPKKRQQQGGDRSKQDLTTSSTNGPSYESKPQTYQYPLNIAIANSVQDFNHHHNQYSTNNHQVLPGQQEFIEYLIHCNPTVVTLPDGPIRQETTSLHLLLKYLHHKQPLSLNVMDLMLLNTPVCAQMVDGSGNSPLHTLLQAIISMGVNHDDVSVDQRVMLYYLEMIQHLLSLYPQSLNRTNQAGITPVQLVQSHQSNFPPMIVDYLVVQQQKLKEKNI